MKTARYSVLVLLVMLLGCQYLGTVQQKWNALTPDQKARIIVSDLQGQLEGLFDTGKSYVATHPEHQDLWKTKIIPAFDVANRSLASVIALGKTKPLTPDYVYQTINPRIVEVVAYLVRIGAVKQ